MSTESRGNWNFPNQIRFGVNRIEELPAACRELEMAKPLLITDRDLGKLPMVRDTLAINDRAGLKTGLFADIQGNPVGKNVEDGVEAYKRGGHDGVVAFGGGSALDAAKAVALMVGQTRPLWDFEDVDDWYTRVNEDGMAPVVAVPTTSGTGSEVGRASVILDAAAHRKKVIFHARMLPARVICDPALTAGMPPKLTGAVGMDALSHNLEAYCAAAFHPMADGIAVEAMRLIHRALPVAFEDGKDLTARAEMMVSSLMGATAFQKGLGAMHAVAHALGGHFDVHHGTAVAVMMPYVLELNRDALEERMVRLARYLGLAQANLEGVKEWVLDLRRDLGIPHTLADFGVTNADVDKLTKLAAIDPTGGTNPVSLDEAKLRGLIREAIKG